MQLISRKVGKYDFHVSEALDEFNTVLRRHIPTSQYDAELRNFIQHRIRRLSILSKRRSLKLRPLYDTIRHLEKVMKSYMMTCECEILLYLYENPRSTAGQIFKISNRSSTAFYAKLKELTEAGVLVCSGTSTDRRSRIYDISSAHSESMRMVIDGTLTSTLHEQALENPKDFVGSRILRKTHPQK